MRTLKVTKADFDEVIYPLVAGHQARGGVSELRSVIRVLDVLDALSDPPEGADGSQAFFRAARDAEPVIELEDADAEYFAQLIEAGIPRIGAARARSMLPWITTLRSAAPVPTDPRPNGGT